MPFVKIDCNILTSSLWVDHDARTLFLTALLLARPWASDVPTPTIKIRSLEAGDYVVPPGEYGFVAAAGIGIAQTAGVSREAAYSALERLAEPEQDSRSGAHGGRRMVRVDGGFLILNYAKYREIDRTNAERQARFKARHKPESNAVTTVTEPLLVTQAEAEADNKAKALSPLPPASGGKVGKSGKPLTESQRAKLEAFRVAQSMLNPIMRRKSSTPWGEDEKKWLKKHVALITPESVELVARFHRADIPKDKDFRRKDMVRLIRYWSGEVDKAKKHFGLDRPTQSKPAAAMPPQWKAFLAELAAMYPSEDARRAILAFKTWDEAESLQPTMRAIFDGWKRGEKIADLLPRLE